MTEEQNVNEGQIPPPEMIPKEEPQMSEVATLANIYIEPGNTFEDLRRKTRWILAMLITVLGLSVFQISFFEKVGFEKVMRGNLESNSRMQRLPDDQREAVIQQQTQPIVKTITYIITPVLFIIGFFIAGLLYWGGANAMGGKIGYFKSLSVFVYSTFAPWLVWELANIVVLVFKAVDDIDLKGGQGGLLNANPNMFLSLKDSPALQALMGSFDLFVVWGLILAAIGLQKIAKLSTGAAWGTVLIVQIFLIALKVVWFSLNG